ncbi:MAG: hypothetical protein GY847_13855, partial [Proteobacteria bacterium]|nr:hypothetical protein [Pseudomonadota bacterium]
MSETVCRARLRATFYHGRRDEPQGGVLFRKLLSIHDIFCVSLLPGAFLFELTDFHSLSCDFSGIIEAQMDAFGKFSEPSAARKDENDALGHRDRAFDEGSTVSSRTETDTLSYLHLIRKKFVMILLPVFVFLSTYSFASEPINIDHTLGIKNISKYVEYIEYRDKTLNIEDVIHSKDWKKISARSINFGYTLSKFWFRFSIVNKTQSDLDFLIETDQPLTDIAEFYIPDDNGKFSKKVSGDHLPFHKRGFDHRNIIFKVMQKPGEHTYFLRIESKDAVSFNISILSSDGLYERARNNLPVYWFYYGILAIMIFYNLFIFISARERAYIFLVLFILS